MGSGSHLNNLEENSESAVLIFVWRDWWNSWRKKSRNYHVLSWKKYGYEYAGLAENSFSLSLCTCVFV
jgi:hypothetical protein